MCQKIRSSKESSGFLLLHHKPRVSDCERRWAFERYRCDPIDSSSPRHMYGRVRDVKSFALLGEWDGRSVAISKAQARIPCSEAQCPQRRASGRYHRSTDCVGSERSPPSLDPRRLGKLPLAKNGVTASRRETSDPFFPRWLLRTFLHFRMAPTMAEMS